MVYLVKIPVTSGTKKAAVVRVAADVATVDTEGTLRFVNKSFTETVAGFNKGNWLYFIQEHNT